MWTAFARSQYGLGELVEQRLLGRCRNIRQNKSHRLVARRTDSAEEIQSLMMKIAVAPRSHAILELVSTDSAGLADSCFILMPDFDPTRLGVRCGDILDHAFEVF